jgi:hypothetical protein
MPADPGFIGRTITGIERPPSEHGDWEDDRRWLLRLDDGTAVEFTAEGYEVDAVTVVHLTEDVLRQRAIDTEAERVAHEEEMQRAHEARERQRIHIEEMKTKLAPNAFKKWRRETYPTHAEILKDAWTGPVARQAFASSSVLDSLR